MPSSAQKPSVPHHIGHAGAPGVGRQGRDVLDDALRPHSSSSFEPFGQNQPTSAIATGIDPHTTAQGVKIEPTNRTETAIAASSGQIDGSGELSRRSGARLGHRRDEELAVVDGEAADDRRAPGARPTAARGSVTSGMRRNCSGGGGEVVAHSSVPASQGLSPARPRRGARSCTTFTDEQQRSSAPGSAAPSVASRFSAAPAHLGADRCRRAAACPAGPRMCIGKKVRLKPMKTSQKCQRPSARSSSGR